MMQCGTANCGYAIDTSGMNAVLLKALRRWKKTCPKCKKMTLWQEQHSLLNTETLQTKTNGGSKNVKSKRNRKKNIEYDH